MTIAAFWPFSLIWIRAVEKEPAQDREGLGEDRHKADIAPRYKNWLSPKIH